MTNLKIIDTAFFSETIPESQDVEIRRDIFIDAIERTFSNFDVILIEGDSGVGKTRLLYQFVKSYSKSTISYFITSSFKFSYNVLSIKESLYNQFYYYLYNTPPPESKIIDDDFLNEFYPTLLKKLKKERNTLYFVFDGFNDISNEDLVLLTSLFSNLPWTKAKFLFSGSYQELSQLFPPKTSYKSIVVTYFSFPETREYFKDLTENEQQLKEIYQICRKGFPERLNQVKRICVEKGGVDKFLEDEIDEKTNLFDLEWEQVKTEVQLLLLSFLAFNDTLVNINKLSILSKINEDEIKTHVLPLSFIESSADKITFFSENFRSYAKRKLEVYRSEVFTNLIDYYEANPTEEESLFNLPSIYQQAKKWEDLVGFLSLDAFVRFIEKAQSLSTIERQFDYGLDASKQFKEFNGEYLRFALHKSSLKELEKYELWESEIEALISIEDFDQALQLANSTLLKEDRLRLLAVIAKKRKENNLGDDKVVLELIKDLYSQVEFESLKSNAVQIAGLLLYSHPDLAMELIENATKTDDGKTSNDMALTYFTLFAAEAKKKTKSTVADLDIINSKIKSEELKDLTKAFLFLSDEYGCKEIIEQATSLKQTSRKLFILRNWILHNTKKDEIYTVIEFALNIIIKAADEDTPNASVLADIASPLPFIKETDMIESLLLLFDSQKDSITTPTKDYIKLQLILAESLVSIDTAAAQDRIFEVFLVVDDLQDLSIKTDCLSMIWIWLAKFDSDGIIEKSLSSSTDFEQQIRVNIKLLLNQTAFHYRMIEFVIITVVKSFPQFIDEIINDVNTEGRKDAAYETAVSSYIRDSKLDDIDFDIIKLFYSKIKSIETKENTLITIIEKFHDEKEKIIDFIPQILSYLNLVLKLQIMENKCFAIVKALQILNLSKEKYGPLINQLKLELNKSWTAIDVQWVRIRVGFLIASELIEVSKDLSIEYVRSTSTIKEDYGLSSSSISKTYILSIELCIKAFGGLIKKGNDLISEIKELDDLIKLVPSNSEKVILWNGIALRLLINKRSDEFRSVIKEYIIPLLNELSIIDLFKKQQTTVAIAPALFYYHSLSFFEEIKSFNGILRDNAILNTCTFILQKQPPGELVEDSEVGYNLEYEEYKDICALLNYLENDYFLYTYIREITRSLKNPKYRLPQVQKNDIVGRLNKLITDKLPSKYGGIKHDGYEIIAQAEVLSLQIYEKSKWNALLERARLVPNLSDKSLIFIFLAESVNTNLKRTKIEMMEEAVSYIQKIPSNYDKSNRFDSTWSIWEELGKPLFKKHWEIAFKSLLVDKDGNLNNLKALIDIAQQHDSSLAEHAVTLLDQEPSRRKFKQPIKKQIATNDKVKAACLDIKLVQELNIQDTLTVCRKNLGELNSGRFVSKNVDDTLNLLEKISETSLSESFDLISFFIQNALKKNESSTSVSNLKLIFNATIVNSKLIEILSMDSVSKMKRRTKTYTSHFDGNSAVVRFGDRDKVDEYIKSWIHDNDIKNIQIIDPYFTERDLGILKTILEFNPSCFVHILTSKENGNNSYENNELEYIKSWKKISSEKPPETSIQIAWIVSTDQNNKKSPFHDRWWIGNDGNVGLYFGTSYNSVGLSKDSLITVMNAEEIQNVSKTVVADYIENRIRRFREYKITYSDFELLLED